MYTSPDQTPRSGSQHPRNDQTPRLLAPLASPEDQHQDKRPAGHDHGKGHHLMHLLMCAPMLLIVGGYLWAGRANLSSGGVLAAVIPAVGCIVMMWLMMRMMNHDSGDDTHH